MKKIYSFAILVLSQRLQTIENKKLKYQEKLYKEIAPLKSLLGNIS
jgi:hypothetical protein